MQKEKIVAWKLKGIDDVYCEDPHVPLTIPLTLGQTVNGIVNGTFKNRCRACGEIIVRPHEILVTMLAPVLEPSRLAITTDLREGL